MVHILPSSDALAQAAAAHASESLKSLLNNRKIVRILVATGASQIAFLEKLVATAGIDWQRIELFHLDEYIGIDAQHPASFVRYIKERILQPTRIPSYYLLDGSAEPHLVVREIGALLTKAPIDLAFAGIGENGHLAFNDPPADFDAEAPYLIVDLDERCRLQQVGEGWFQSIADVPHQAISISIKQLLQSREIISVVPGKQKAMAVHACLNGRVTPLAPASALRLHPKTTIYLDSDSASLLSEPIDS